MPSTVTAQITAAGVITLPKSADLRAGDTYTLLDLGDVFVLSPRPEAVDAVADYIAEGLRQSGATLETILQDIREQRAAYEPRS